MSLPAPGFSLLELLIVVAVLCALAGGVVVQLGGADRQMREQLATAELAELREAVLRFEQDLGRRPAMANGPADLSELLALPAGASAWDPVYRRGWRGPYLNKPGPGLARVDLGGTLADIPAMADPFPAPPSGPGDNTWTALADGLTPVARAQARQGRAYRLFDLAERARARAASFGADGRPGGGDDLVLCLYGPGCEAP